MHTHSSQTYFQKAFLLIAFLFTVNFVFAQVDKEKEDSTDKAMGVLATYSVNVPPPPAPEPEVISVISCDPKNPNKSGLNDDIIVTIKNPESFFEAAKMHNAKVVLFINNKPVRDVVYETTPDGVRFFMPHDGDVAKLWEYLMLSRGNDEFFEKKVAVSVGIENQDSLQVTSLDPIKTKVDGKGSRTYTLILVRKTWFVICIIILIAVIILFIIMARRSDMLRDTGPQPATGRKTYSLARVQMAVWFLVIISSWLMLYVCLHHFDLLSENILILMGITAGTGVGGLALDTNKAQDVATPSEGILKDLISDHSNISLFRFQNFAWTIVLVLVFIRSVIVYMKMPEFDMTLLLLMGISSGTYIGAKVTEKRVAEDAETAAAEDDQQPK